MMANRRPRRTEASIHAARLLSTIGDELREARLAAGLTQDRVARAMGTTRKRLSRIETAHAPLVPLADLALAAGLVGLRLSTKLYPAGPPIRDQAQFTLLHRFRRRLSPAVGVQLEVPIAGPGDQRAWDMALRVGEVTCGVEAITRLRDVQAQVRAARLKQRDDAVERLILLIGGGAANRRALAGAVALQAAFPVSPRAALRALAAGRDPGGDAIILL